ncbi:MAG: LuxR C-terminal-related transcriptional regulator [Rhodobacteraceae bacterium]|jgi:DNA-binding CsgD family transcriptional regulator|nr:LuxR C-terminal-related transcriptional regulator [Paracoccaceae bacterium]
MMLETAWSLAPQLIRSIDRPDFYASVANTIRTRISTRAVSAYVLSPDHPPEMRLQSIPALTLERRVLPLNAFQDWAYAYDPFYRHIVRSSQHGTFALSEVLTDDAESEIFRREFYHKVEGMDEIGVLVPLGQKRTLALYFVRPQGTRHFTQSEVGLVKDLTPILNECVALHESLRGKQVSPAGFNAQWRRALEHFGRSVVTGREHQVLQMTLLGQTAQETADLTGLALGTVKNHRKAIYRKLGVQSLSELMAVFLRTAGFANGRDDPLESCTMPGAATLDGGMALGAAVSRPARGRSPRASTPQPGPTARMDA